jgi:iron complex outermembrane receptor protein
VVITRFIPTTFKHSLFLLSLISQCSYADTAAEEDTQLRNYVLDDITITAQKAEQKAQDVGIAITTFSNQDLKELGILLPTDISNQLPNVQVVKSALPVFSIRGVGLSEFSPNLDAPVAIHIDEVYLSKAFQATSSLFDMEKVEVLRGPQGTLFGRNTTGGSVNYTTRKPTAEFESGFSFEYSRFERKKTEAYISGPISDNLLGRLSGFVRQSSDGPTYNEFDGKDLGELDELALRGQLLWFPNDNTEVLLSLHGGEDNSERLTYDVRGTYDASVYPGILQSCPAYFTKQFTANSSGCLLPSGKAGTDDDPFTTSTNRANQLDNENFGASLHFITDLPWATLTSITAYEFYERDLNEDFDGSTDTAFEIDWFSELHEYTQEFRLSSLNNTKNSWLVGLFYEHDDFDVINLLSTGDHALAAFNGLTLATSYKQTSDSFALFGHNEYLFTEQWSIITGLRYTWERTHFDGLTQAQSATAPTIGEENKLSSPFLTLAQRDAVHQIQNLSFKLGLNFQPNDNQLYYGSISSGFKTGGFNGGFAFSDVEFSEYKPEEILAYELGSKLTLLDQHLQINTSLFYYQLSNPQLNADAPTPPNFITTNADSSTHIGAEIEAWWRPLQGLDVKFSLGWLDAEYGEFFVFGVNQKGNKVVNSPEWTFNGLIRYEYPLDNSLKIITMTDFSYRSDRYLSSNNVHTSYEPGYWLVNARIALASNDNKLELGIWARNLTHQDYRNYMNDVNGLGIVADLWNEPYTYGMDISYKF